VGEASAEQVTIAVGKAVQVSGLIQRPPRARWCLVLAHGAGAGMRHPFMGEVADGLAERGVATLRYQFPFIERRARRPDPPGLAHEAVRAAIAKAAELLPALPLIAGGKSFGGRMTSQAQAAKALSGVRGLVFFGFPLHPPDEPSVTRAEHLSEVQVPMLFLQGTRDAFAQLPLLEPLVQRLGSRASLKLLDGADHSFHVPARSGSNDAEVRTILLQALVEWADSVLGIR
jgi:predicted alpha/beta-hydrolase family hydrolase